MSEHRLHTSHPKKKSVISFGRGRWVCTYVCAHSACAVVFIIVLALLAFTARPDHGANSDTVTDLDGFDFGANTYCLANNLVPL
jgi:hypothetical protein